jgi:hypothetical protein
MDKKICKQFQHQLYNEIIYTAFSKYILVLADMLYKLCIIYIN